MPNANDLRKNLSTPTPLYFAAGVIDMIREEAPQRIAAVRETDPKEVQARFTKQAKETQAKVSETLGGIDTDIKKLREQAQHLALQSVGIAAEYAVKARETYDDLAERGREAVQNWRGEEEREAPEVTVEREPVKVAEPPAEPTAKSAPRTGTKAETNAEAKSGTKAEAKSEPKSAKPDAATSASPASGTSATSAKKTGAARKTTPTTRKTAPKTES